MTGEAGIGKSRLLAEQARRVHQTAAIVLAGRAPEETVVPFQPFLEAIGQYVHGAGEPALRVALTGCGAELARLVPEIGVAYRSSSRLRPAIRRPIATGCSRRS